MVETDFFLLSPADYKLAREDAEELGITVDYLLLEFCDVEGEDVYLN